MDKKQTATPDGTAVRVGSLTDVVFLSYGRLVKILFGSRGNGCLDASTKEAAPPGAQIKIYIVGILRRCF